MWEDARQDLGLQVLGHHPPRVPADGQQHVTGRILVRLFQLLEGGGREEEWASGQSFGISYARSGLVGGSF